MGDKALRGLPGDAQLVTPARVKPKLVAPPVRVPVKVGYRVVYYVDCDILNGGHLGDCVKVEGDTIAIRVASGDGVRTFSSVRHVSNPLINDERKRKLGCWDYAETRETVLVAELTENLSRALNRIEILEQKVEIFLPNTDDAADEIPDRETGSLPLPPNDPGEDEEFEETDDQDETP
jgi:hypothetical protein